MSLVRGRTAAVLLLCASAAVGCSSDAAGPSVTDGPTVTICDPSGEPQAEEDLPAVASVRTAIADLDARLGVPQQYFEVNATARLVNLFVALNGGTVAQAWVWVDGELTSAEPQPASGGTFTLADVDLDESVALTTVRSEIPDALLESFYVHGDGAGNVQYGVLTSALCGGGLEVIVGADGAVKSVDPVN